MVAGGDVACKIREEHEDEESLEIGEEGGSRGWDPRLHAQIMNAIGVPDANDSMGVLPRAASPLLVMLGGTSGSGGGASEAGLASSRAGTPPGFLSLPFGPAQTYGRLPTHPPHQHANPSSLSAALELSQAAFWSGSISPVTFEIERTFNSYLDLPHPGASPLDAAVDEGNILATTLQADAAVD